MPLQQTQVFVQTQFNQFLRDKKINVWTEAVCNEYIQRIFSCDRKMSETLKDKIFSLIEFTTTKLWDEVLHPQGYQQPFLALLLQIIKGHYYEQALQALFQSICLSQNPAQARMPSASPSASAAASGPIDVEAGVFNIPSPDLPAIDKVSAAAAAYKERKAWLQIIIDELMGVGKYEVVGDDKPLSSFGVVPPGYPNERVPKNEYGVPIMPFLQTLQELGFDTSGMKPADFYYGRFFGVDLNPATTNTLIMWGRWKAEKMARAPVAAGQIVIYRADLPRAALGIRCHVSERNDIRAALEELLGSCITVSEQMPDMVFIDSPQGRGMTGAYVAMCVSEAQRRLIINCGKPINTIKVMERLGLSSDAVHIMGREIDFKPQCIPPDADRLYFKHIRSTHAVFPGFAFASPKIQAVLNGLWEEIVRHSSELLILEREEEHLIFDHYPLPEAKVNAKGVQITKKKKDLANAHKAYKDYCAKNACKQNSSMLMAASSAAASVRVPWPQEENCQHIGLPTHVGHNNFLERTYNGRGMWENKYSCKVCGGKFVGKHGQITGIVPRE